jgi:hypothetical protein
VEEKVSEYRQERQEKELRRSVHNVRISENDEFRRENGDADADTFSSLPHSLSESLLLFESTSNKFETLSNKSELTSNKSESASNKSESTSNKFESTSNKFEKEDELEADATSTTTPSSTPPQLGILSSAATPASRSQEHSPREKRRFTFAFRERSSKTSIVKNEEPTTTATSTVTTGNVDTTTSHIESTPQTINSTPTKSSRFRYKIILFIEELQQYFSFKLPNKMNSEIIILFYEMFALSTQKDLKIDFN